MRKKDVMIYLAYAMIIVMINVLIFANTKESTVAGEIIPASNFINENIKSIDWNTETTDASTTETDENYDANTNIRCVVMNNDYSSIYHNNVTIKCNGDAILYYGENLKQYKKIEKNEEFNLTTQDSMWSGDKICLKLQDNTFSKLSVKRNSENTKYWGNFDFYLKDCGIVIVNEVPLKEYLYGVVASEMPNTFSLEAIKAQAVCARTYAIKQLNNEKQVYEEYDASLDDSTYYQVYNINKKTKKAIKAVDQTDGMIITYDGNPIDAYYFSTSCGMTADGEVLSSACSYLKSRSVSAEVVNTSTDSEKEKIILEKDLPYYKWSLEISAEDICNNIGIYTDATATNIQDIIVEESEESGIVTKIRIIDDENEIEVCGQQNIRNILCSYGTEITLNDNSVRNDFSMLPSAFISIEKENKDNGVFFKINGGGFGHGCGMSQNGANEMAKIGKNYEEILKAFYSDIDIINFSEV